MGSTFYLPRLDGELGMYLALTGKRLEGADISVAGLATHHVTADSLKYFEMDTSTNSFPLTFLDAEHCSSSC